MKKHCTGVIAAAVVAFTASLAAQGQSPANVPPADANAAPGAQKTAPAPSAQTRAADTVTIAGCLESSPAAAGASATSFVLANAQMSGARASGGAVGTAGSTSPSSYRLEGEEKMLSPHLNHQVRITGMVQSSSASATGAARAAGGSTAAGATLKVEKVEMVAATCEPAPAATAPRTAPAQPAQPAEPGRTEKPAQPGQPAVPPGR
jgi:hypothetical protein